MRTWGLGIVSSWMLLASTAAAQAPAPSATPDGRVFYFPPATPAQPAPPVTPPAQPTQPAPAQPTAPPAQPVAQPTQPAPAQPTAAPAPAQPAPAPPPYAAPAAAPPAQAWGPPAWTHDKRGRPRNTISAEPGMTPPYGYRNDTRSTLGLLIPGIVLLPVAYGATVLTSLTCGTLDAVGTTRGDCGTADWAWGALPLFGPFLVAADDGLDSGWRSGYAIYGVVQNVGLGLIIAGATIRQPIWKLEPQYRQAGGSTLEAEVFMGPGLMGVKGRF